MKVKVAAARNKDIGRGIGRIDPKTMEDLGAGVGDIIEISGKRTTCVKVMPSFPEDRGKWTFSIDGTVMISLHPRTTGCSQRPDKAVLVIYSFSSTPAVESVRTGTSNY